MAQRIHRFDITSPPNATVSTPTSDRTDFPPGVVTALTVEFPAGLRGKVGVAVTYGNNQIIPLGGTAWLKGDHKSIRYDFDDPFPGGIGWFVDHFNAGKRAHTIHFAVEVDDVAFESLLPPVVLLPLGEGGPEIFGEDGVTIIPPGGGGGGEPVQV